MEGVGGGYVDGVANWGRFFLREKFHAKRTVYDKKKGIISEYPVLRMARDSEMM